MRIQLGLTRIEDTGNGTTRLIQLNEDMITIDLPPGQAIHRIWALADGMDILDIPIEGI